MGKKNNEVEIEWLSELVICGNLMSCHGTQLSPKVLPLYVLDGYPVLPYIAENSENNVSGSWAVQNYIQAKLRI